MPKVNIGLILISPTSKAQLITPIEGQSGYIPLIPCTALYQSRGTFNSKFKIHTVDDICDFRFSLSPGNVQLWES